MGADHKTPGKITAKGLLWAKMLRAAFFPLSLFPVGMGAATAAAAGEVSPCRFFLVVLGVLCYHAGANVFNDFYDEVSGNDRLNTYHSPYSGGGRLLQKGQVSLLALRRAAVLLYVAGSTAFLGLAVTGGGWGVPALGAAGLFGGFFYSAPPLQLAGRGWGEAVIGLCFGPLLVSGTELALTGSLPLRTILLSIPFGFLIAAVILINEFPDLEADRLTGKFTLVVRMGRRRSMNLFGLLLFSAFFFIIANILLFRLPFAWLSLLALPVAFRAYLLGRKFYKDPRRILPACAATIKTHFFTSLLLVLSVWLGNRGGI